MVDRVRRPAAYERLFEELKEQKLFSTFKDIMIFAAALGFERKNRKEFSKSAEPIDKRIFNGPLDRSFMNALALAEDPAHDPMILADAREEDRLRTLEEYANGGLEILDNLLSGSAEEWEYALVTLMLEGQQQDSLLNKITDLA